MYNGFIHSNYGQGVAYSDDGINWTSVVAGNSAGGYNDMLDKNHLWIDNNPNSPYEGNVYDAWTDFGGGGGAGFDSNIGFVRSTDGGATYSTPINISSATSAYLNQGVNINSGKNGEVYAVWTVYETSSDLQEDAIGFAKSLDGGATFLPATKIITNLKGIRDAGVSKQMRVNSFPVMSVNMQTGDLYVVWTNIGFPGTNTGTNYSVYMIKSTDNGDTWSTPIRVNQGSNDDGKEAYMPWITCDPETGTVSVIYFDDRDVSSTQVETWVSNSFDGGETWEAFRVSDVAFTPSPLPGMAQDYMGDYIGISARGGKVYPVWSDNRSGSLFAYCSTYETNNLDRPENVVATLTDNVTGATNVTWNFTGTKAFQNFKIYRDGVFLGTTTELTYNDILPEPGTYIYEVSAMHDQGESSKVQGSVTWGIASISVNPSSLSQILLTNQTATQYVTITNNGQINLTYNTSTQITSKSKAYCDASGAGNDEYISNVQFAEINNTTGYTPYSDFTSIVANVDAGNSYDITVSNGNTYSTDDLGVWIDWNQDEDFDDPGENVVCESSNGGQGTYSIAVPADALGGQTRMRIRIKYYDTDCGSPCGTTNYGEVEDYTVNVNSWLLTSNTTGSVLPGTSTIIPVTFNSTGLADGTYNANIKIMNNDATNSTVTVPVTLEVTATAPLTSNANADNTEVCNGSSVTLNSNAAGGSGTYTYSWTATPGSYTSTDSDPIVSPSEDTEYTVVVSDGIETTSSFVSLTINDVPGVPETATGDTEFCQDVSNTIYETVGATNATHYTWIVTPSNAGTISGSQKVGNVSWNSSFSGVANVSVTANNQCGATANTTPISVNINELPNVTLSNFTNVYANDEPLTLTGGLPEGGNYYGTGITGNIFDPAVAGEGTHTIRYVYSDANSCESEATAEIEVMAPAGISAFDNGTYIKIYPNPNNGIFNIKINSKESKDINISVINQIGMNVYNKNINSKESDFSIDLSNFTSGIYFVTIKGNNVNTYKKIVIQK